MGVAGGHEVDDGEHLGGGGGRGMKKKWEGEEVG